MANLLVKDANGDIQEIKATGAGTTGDPFILERLVPLPTGAATAAKQDTQITAEQAILAKLLAAPATEAKQDAAIALLTTQAGYLDGLETVLGAVADAAVITDANGSLSAKLRGLVKWAFERMPAALGQGTKAQSLAVVLPSDYQAPVLPTNVSPVVTSVGANNTDMVAAMDVSNYRFGSLQLSGFGTATVQVQVSNDGGATWVALPTPLVASGVASVMNASGFYYFLLPAVGLMRIRTTTYSSGTIAGSLLLSSLPPPLNVVSLPSTQQVTAVGTGTPADGVTNPVNASNSNALANGFNGTTWDRQRNNNAVSVLASAARTATISTDVTNYNGNTFAVVLNITAAPNTASEIVINIRAKDSISGNYVTLLSSVAIVGSASQSPPYTNRYRVGPNIAVVANVSAADALARTMNVQVVHSNADSWTYSISADIGV